MKLIFLPPTFMKICMNSFSARVFFQEADCVHAAVEWAPRARSYDEINSPVNLTCDWQAEQAALQTFAKQQGVGGGGGCGRRGSLLPASLLPPGAPHILVSEPSVTDFRETASGTISPRRASTASVGPVIIPVCQLQALFHISAFCDCTELNWTDEKRLEYFSDGRVTISRWNQSRSKLWRWWYQLQPLITLSSAFFVSSVQFSYKIYDSRKSYNRNYDGCANA